MLWFFIKLVIVFACFIWVRASLPRIRYDQLMAFGWKVLIPLNLAWILMVAIFRAMRLPENRTMPAYIIASLVAIGVLALIWRFSSVWDKNAADKAVEVEEEFARLREEPSAGGFPVPPLDLPHYHGSRAVESAAGVGPSERDHSHGATGAPRKEVPSGSN
jgi:NADH-quinone oxidoreductase subunit H